MRILTTCSTTTTLRRDIISHHIRVCVCACLCMPISLRLKAVIYVFCVYIYIYLDKNVCNLGRIATIKLSNWIHNRTHTILTTNNIIEIPFFVVQFPDSKFVYCYCYRIYMPSFGINRKSNTVRWDSDSAERKIITVFINMYAH